MAYDFVLKYLQSDVLTSGICALEICMLHVMLLIKWTFRWDFTECLKVEKMHSARSSCLTTVVSSDSGAWACPASNCGGDGARSRSDAIIKPCLSQVLDGQTPSVMRSSHGCVCCLPFPMQSRSGLSHSSLKRSFSLHNSPSRQAVSMSQLRLC